MATTLKFGRLLLNTSALHLYGYNKFSTMIPLFVDLQIESRFR